MQLRRSHFLLSALATLVAPTLASADPPNHGPEYFPYRSASDRLAFDVQLLEPSTSPNSITTVDLATIPSHLTFTAGLWTNYAHHPFVIDTTPAGSTMTTTRPIVSDLWQSELHASLGLFEYFELGLALPLTYTNHVEAAGLTPETYGTGTFVDSVRLGDLRADVKVPILRGAWPIAVRLAASFPTGGHDAFSGALSWTLTPELVASHAFGPLTAAVNVGYRLRERNGLEAPPGNDSFVVDDEVVYRVGARYAITPRVAVNAELIGRIGVSAGPWTASRLPLVAIGGGTVQVTDALGVQLGVERGITGGYGTPDIGVYAGARYSVTRGRCAEGPEDYDGFEDGDYCADPDNDRDGIPDVRDRCPNDAEDRDGFLDDDGCPDPDNDADGVADDNDRCPNEPEDHDGFEDGDGCPEGDNDRDGVPDATDECPNDPEDPDNYQDDDGCPEPGPEAAVVTRTESHLLLSQRIFFDYDSDTIRSVSLPILNEVALTLRRNPDITRVRIEGYTDGQGGHQYNLDLSYRRARAVVEYLVSQSVTRERLEYQGYGDTHPVAPDSTPEGQALNRRVDFTIIAQGGAAAPTAPTSSPATAPTAAPDGHGRHHHHAH